MHLTDQEITSYKDHSLPPEQVLRVRRHSDDCAECRARLAGDPSDAAVLRALFSNEPNEQELVEFVVGCLPETRTREIETHVSVCVQCAEAIEDLRRFAPAVPPSPRVVALPARKWRTWMQIGALAAAALIAAVSIGGLLRHRPAPPPLVASLHDGIGMDTLTAAGELGGLPNLDPQEKSWIADALRTGRLPAGAPLTAGHPGVLRGAADAAAFRLLSPVDRRVVDDRPEFRWEPMPGASTYEVTVFTEDENIVAHGTTAGSSWRPDAALPRGVRLNWQVSAKHGGAQTIAPAPPAAPVSFELISSDSAARIERTRGGSHLQLAVLYAHAGLIDEAQSELTALEAANPGSSLVKQMRDSLPR